MQAETSSLAGYKKAIVIGDLHLGKRIRLYPERDEHVIEALSGVLEAHDPDLVIFAGDVFDTSTPPPRVVSSLVSTLYRERGRVVVMLDGNHDLGVNGSALDIFRNQAFRKLSFIVPERGSIMRIGDLTLGGWGTDFTAEEVGPIVIGHGTHHESPMAPPSIRGDELIAFDPDNAPQHVILGHLHAHHEFKGLEGGEAVVYTGPFVQMAFGEGDPGYVLITGDGPSWHPLRVGLRFVKHEDWKGEKAAIVRATAKTEAEAEAIAASLEASGVHRHEVLVIPEASLTKASKRVLDGFNTGGPVSAYTNYRLERGQEPRREVIELLSAVS